MFAHSWRTRTGAIEKDPRRAPAKSFRLRVAYWKLDETTAGATANDESDNGYDGTPAGTGGPQPSSETAPTEFSNARSLNFDGNDYVNAGTFNVTGNKTTLSGSDRPFDGLIDDVRVYNMALTGAQILSLARGNP